MKFSGTLFNRTILVLSFVSLLMDVSSEMLFPVLPVYLSSIGFSAAYIGIIEGIADGVVGISKIYFARQSDATGNRIGFVKSGYLLSTVSKPLIIILKFPLWVLGVRVLDRLGKGIRTGPRDAMLAEATVHEKSGSVFGFHRAMDSLGAAVGPAIALIYLVMFPGRYENLFLIAFIPGIVAVALLFALRKNKNSKTKKVDFSLQQIGSFWNRSSPAYRKLIIGLLFFSLFVPSTAFVILLGKQANISDPILIGVYIAYNLFYAFLSYPLGKLSDALGRKKVFVSGIIFIVAAYLVFAFTESFSFLLLGFLLYAVYSAATDGIAKAWINENSSVEEKATAFAFYAGFQSVVIIVANLFAGLIWTFYGSNKMFLFLLVGSLISLLYIYKHSPKLRINSP